jgi:hypothetical protein
MKLRSSLFMTAVVAALCLIPSPSASAQNVYAAITQNVYAAINGTVTDTSGAVVPNAKVTVLNASPNITTPATTDSKGYYVVSQLAIAGPYTVTIDKTGFQASKTVGLTLQLNDFTEIAL